MSHPACLLYDISELKARDMDCMDIAKTEEGLEPQDENQKIEKLKESHLLLKKKLSLSHELIKQYNDKIKECQELTEELETVKNDVQKITKNHNTSLTKIKQLELENGEYKKKIDNFTRIISEQETKTAADRQHLQQLIFKVKELERKETGNSKRDEACKEKIKTLEVKLKEVKKSHEIEMKEMELKLANVVIPEMKNEPKVGHDKSTDTGNDLEPVKVLPEMVNEFTMTNEFYSIKDDPYPLFCSKCQVKLNPAPLDQILKQMSSCPALLTEVRSPAKNSSKVSGTSFSHLTLEATSQVKSFHREPILYNGLNDRSTSSETLERNNQDVTKSDFQKLEHKVCLLERKLRKKLKKHEANRIATCCSYQHPNNCYFGPYPGGFLQPGPAMRNDAEFVEFQRWQESLRNRRRSLIAANKGESRRGKRKFRKNRKLEGVTSGWNVDSFPDKDLPNSDRVNTWGSDSETVEDSLRAESPLTQFEEPTSSPSKRRKLSESCSFLRRKKQKEKLIDLFSPAQSPPPRTEDRESNASTDDESSNETRDPSPKLNCSLSETFSGEEAVENGTDTPERSLEYEEVERTSKKRKKGDTKPLKKSTKSSLVSKIRNLKKNCNKIKPLTKSDYTASDSTVSKLIRNKMNGEISVANKPKNNPSIIKPLTKVDQTANNIGDYCLVKKQRIAHSAHKTENESVNGNVDKNFEQVSNIVDKDKETVDFIEEDSRVNNDRSHHPAAKIEKVNVRVEKNEIVEWKEDSNPVVRFKRSSSLKNAIDANNSRLANNKAVKNVEVEPVLNNVDRISSPSISEGNKTLTAPLQPCIMIPKQYLGIEDVTDDLETVKNTESNETAEEDHSLGNSNSSIGNDASLRILRSHSKANESIISCDGTTELPKSRTSEISEPGMEVCEALVSVRSDKCGKSSAEIFENDKVESAIVGSVKYKRKAKVKALSVSPMRELRSRRIMLSPSNTINKIAFVKEKMEEETMPIGEHESEKVIERLSFGPRALIEEHFTEMINSKKKNTTKLKSADEKLQQRRENLVIEELSKLAEDERWTTAALHDAIEALSTFKTHTIARCIVDFLCTKAETNEALDRTHTPPAPLLSKTQQRILTLLVVLRRTIPDIVRLVLAGIEYKLFRLGWAPEVEQITELARFFTALCRIERDRERVRILCCDALYCLGLKAMCLIYVVFTSWPEILPMAGSSSDPLLLCLVEIIMTQQGEQTFPKFFALKKLLSTYYKYEPGGEGGKTLIKKFLQTLKDERQNGLDSAIILIAKKKEPNWTYENIIKGGLLQMIVQNAHPSIYDAFSLLGHLMRSFPIEDKKDVIKNLFDQLRALMESGEGSMQQQEGVATALLSLTRHKFYDVAKVIMNWEPREPISETLSMELKTLFDIYPQNWWRKFIRKNCRTKSI